MRGAFAGVALALATLLAASLVRADGGTPILREARGSLIVTLLAEPTPLRSGSAVFEVLVQSRTTGEPLLDVPVRLRLSGPDAADGQGVEALPEVAGNRLFRAARVRLPRPGLWRIEVLVTGPEEQEAFRAQLEVIPRESPASRYWPYIAVTPLGLALLALHQARSLAGTRTRSRGTRRANPSRRRGRPGAPSGLP